jgi:hypothetical protein
MKRNCCIIAAVLVSATLALTNSADANGGRGGSAGRGGSGGSGFKGGSSNKGGWAGSNKGGWAGHAKIKMHHSLAKRYGGFIPESPDTAKYGVEILEIYRGAAADQGLRPSDVIVSFDDMATPTRDHLYAAVDQADREAEVVYLNGESGEYCRVTLYPRNGLIGVLPGESVRIE